MAPNGRPLNRGGTTMEATLFNTLFCSLAAGVAAVSVVVFLFKQIG